MAVATSLERRSRSPTMKRPGPPHSAFIRLPNSVNAVCSLDRAVLSSERLQGCDSRGRPVGKIPHLDHARRHTYLLPSLDGMSGGAGDCCREPRTSIRQWRTCLGAGTGDACSSSLRTEQLPMRQGPSNDLHAGLPDGSSLLVPEGGVRLPHFPPVSGTALRSGSQFWMEPGARSRNCASRLAQAPRACCGAGICLFRDTRQGRKTNLARLPQRVRFRFWFAFDPPPGDALAVSTALAGG